MANEPKLNVFVIKLHAEKTPSFFRRFMSSSDINEPDASVFLNMCQSFINKLDAKKFHQNSKSGKAFTGQKNSEDGKLDIDFDSGNFVLEGTIDGGRFGDEWEKSKIGDKTVREKLAEDDVLTRKFYFFLHTRLDSDKGVLMVQSYSNDSITNDFVKFIKLFFAHESKKYKEASAERFIPNSIIEEFKEQSIVKSFSFKSDLLIGHIDNNAIGENSEEFVVTIKVESKKGIKKKDYDRWMNDMSQGQFILGKSIKKFTDFTKRHATVKNSVLNKSSSFELSRKFDIKPIIYLDDNKVKFIGKKIDFESLKKYCYTILREIEKEIYRR